MPHAVGPSSSAPSVDDFTVALPPEAGQMIEDNFAALALPNQSRRVYDCWDAAKKASWTTAQPPIHERSCTR